jgi:hypothetical protein
VRDDENGVVIEARAAAVGGNALAVATDLAGVHGRYQRRWPTFPLAGRPAVIRFAGWSASKPDRGRSTFAEQVAGLTAPHAHKIFVRTELLDR